jgi:hypothetical protein
VHIALFCAVCAAAVALFAVGGPLAPGVIVTMVELLVEVARPDAVSLAMMIAVTPLFALATAVTTPAVLTAATAVFDEVNVSPDAGSILVDPSL